MIKTYKTKLNLNNRQKTKLHANAGGACGFEVDRDYNASLNLKQYREFHGNLSLWRTKQNLSSNSNVIKESSMKKEVYVDFISNDKILVS